MNTDAYNIEEYKQVKSRLETHESRYYQMLVLTVTGFSAILGFSQKIPHFLIPIMLFLFLVVLSRVSLLSRIHQFFCAAYLLVNFDQKFSCLNFEKVYIKVFESHSNKYKKLGEKAFFIFKIANHPFMILNYLAILASLHFGSEYVANKWNLEDEWFKAVLYVCLLTFLCLLVIKSVVTTHKLNPVYFREIVGKPNVES